jgi:peroxiredoxin
MSPRPQVGDQAPDLTLPMDTGKSFGLTDVAGHPTLVSFLSHAA